MLVTDLSTEAGIAQLKTDAVMSFVNLMIGAYDSGFVDTNNPTLAEIHQVARNHIKDSYGIDTPSIVEQWGVDVARECGLGEEVEEE